MIIKKDFWVRAKLAIIVNTFTDIGLFKKYVCRAGGGALKSELKRTVGGGSSLSVRSLCDKNCQVFKRQTKFFLINCLAVANCFLF